MRRLTPRQLEIVGLLAAELNCPQIARRLGISVKTVRNHVVAIDARLSEIRPRDPDVPVLRWVRRHAADLLDAA